MALVAGSTAIAQTTAGDESDAIKKRAFDYIEGWYAGVNGSDSSFSLPLF